MKRLIVFAFVLTALLSACALSEETISIRSGESGVVERYTAPSRTRALIRELNMAYVEMDGPYLTQEKQTRFTAHVTGGDGIYTYTFSVFRRSGNEGLFYQQATSGQTRANTYYYTPKTESGQYILSVRVTDSAGSYIQWQSHVYESSSHACAEKARSVADECIKNAGSDYARALWLHDWLIHYADYDHSFTHYYPDGVLLYGKGVCQSYALAYEMLLKLVGIDSVYVTGTANGGSHGWNLVNIDDRWFHVDCTWDDPAPGQENHKYFCVPDSVMLKDHTWRHEVQILPESTGVDYMYMLRSGVDTCVNEKDVKRILDEALKNRRGYVEIWYTGASDAFDFHMVFNAWYNQADFPAGLRNCRYTVRESSLAVEFNYGNGFPDLSLPETMVIDPLDSGLEAGDEARLLVLSVPSSADLSGLIWKSSNPVCISVDGSGLIRALRPGYSVITAVHPNGKEAKIDLYVDSHINLLLPDTILIVEEGAFQNCDLFEHVTVPEGVREIHDSAFSGCALLKTIVIPETVSYIGKDVFAGCKRVVIECVPDSFAHAYAVSHSIPFRFMSTEP